MNRQLRDTRQETNGGRGMKLRTVGWGWGGVEGCITTPTRTDKGHCPLEIIDLS